MCMALSSPLQLLDRCSCSHQHFLNQLNSGPALPTANLWQETQNRSSTHTYEHAYICRHACIDSIHAIRALKHIECIFWAFTVKPEDVLVLEKYCEVRYSASQFTDQGAG